MNRSEIQVSQPKQAIELLRASKSAKNLSGRRFHFIGAGGIGMSGLAQILLSNGAKVSGSDQQVSHIISRLCQLGADIRVGHHEDNFDAGTDTVVISAAVKPDNPELLLAKASGCQIKKYAQMLGDLMDKFDGIAISGTHGKSTTAGWLVYSLKRAGLEPNFLVGAEIGQLGCSSGVGQSEYFVAEACEYDRSFLNLKPKIGCILNIEADHLDYYRDHDDIVEAFGDFACNILPGGMLVGNGQDKNIAKAADRISKDVKFISFGFDDGCNFTAKNINLEKGYYSFDVCHNGENLGRAKTSLPGYHNVSNGLAVIAMAISCGVKPEKIIGQLNDFTGIDRRLMLKAQINDITIVDDYAHHPTEIRASLDAIRQRYSPNRLWCVFQPHQYSRTRFLLDDFAESFKLADVAIIPDIYFVRDTESSKKKVNSQKLVQRIRESGTEALFMAGFDEICGYLGSNVRPGDLVVTMGAGDVWKVSDEYIQWLRGNS